MHPLVTLKILLGLIETKFLFSLTSYIHAYATTDRGKKQQQKIISNDTHTRTFTLIPTFHTKLTHSITSITTKYAIEQFFFSSKSLFITSHFLQYFPCAIIACGWISWQWSFTWTYDQSVDWPIMHIWSGIILVRPIKPFYKCFQCDLNIKIAVSTIHFARY